MQAEPVHDSGSVKLGRAHGNVQLVGNFFGGAAGGDQAQNLALTHGEFVA
jgi:hypothetical protein